MSSASPVDPAESAPGVSLASRARAPRWPIAAIVAFYAFIALVTFDYIEEDAYIYYRVAANIAAGHGYVFNAGGERIETGSSLGWQYVLVLGRLLRLDLVLFSKVLGILLGGATLYLVWCISLRLVERAWLRVMPALLLAVTIPFYGWVQRGLETPLYVFAIVVLGFCVVEPRLRRFWYLAALLVALSRSEGFIAILGLAGFFICERHNLRAHWRGLATYAAVLLLTYSWRLLYFHDLVPHAFYVKIEEHPGYGRTAALAFLKVTHLWLILVPAAVGLLRRRAWDRVLMALAVLDVPFLWWGFQHHGFQEYNRHLVPALPLLYVVAARGLDQLVLRWPILVRSVAWGSATFVLWMAFASPKLNRRLEPGPNLFAYRLRRTIEQPRQVAGDFAALVARRPRSFVPSELYVSDAITQNWQFLVGDFIHRTYPPGIVVAYDQMGQTPWYAGLDKTFIDTWGLTYRTTGYAVFDHQLASSKSALHSSYRELSESLARFWREPTRKLDLKQAADHVFALEPHLIILNTLVIYERRDDGTRSFASTQVPGLIAQDPRLKERYIERKKSWSLLVYERRDLAARIPWSAEDHLTPGKPDITIKKQTTAKEGTD
jgi:hypothetical protein